jgi:hypothetical protein
VGEGSERKEPTFSLPKSQPNAAPTPPPKKGEAVMMGWELPLMVEHAREVGGRV